MQRGGNCNSKNLVNEKMTSESGGAGMSSMDRGYWIVFPKRNGKQNKEPQLGFKEASGAKGKRNKGRVIQSMFWALGVGRREPSSFWSSLVHLPSFSQHLGGISVPQAADTTVDKTLRSSCQNQNTRSGSCWKLG